MPLLATLFWVQPRISLAFATRARYWPIVNPGVHQDPQGIFRQAAFQL